jgi:hypothetical protein
MKLLSEPKAELNMGHWWKLRGLEQPEASLLPGFQWRMCITEGSREDAIQQGA